MAGSGDGSAALYIRTPCIHSIPMSKGRYSVYLKLENLQIPGSFKQRGISHFCKKAIQNGATRFVCASGGNAGLAVAYSANCLSVPAVVVLPTTTPELVADKIRDMGAKVIRYGDVWDESNAYAQKMATDPGCVYVHPFDHPDIWEGHSSMMVEAREQMPVQPDVVVAAVGGGGLLTGVVQGMWNVGWNDVPVVAMETEGAESYYKAVEAGKLVTLPAITSVAKSLGSLTACAASLEKSTKHQILPTLVTDQEAVEACIKFSEDHRMLVEPACGASLAAVYSDVIPRLQKEGKLGTVNSVLVIVCGGSAVTIDKLQQKFGLYVAKCLGSLTVCPASLEQSTKHKILPNLVTDQEAVEACITFAEDHRMLVQPACGASLAAVYSDVIPRLQKEGKLGTVNSVLVIVCGGCAVTIDRLQQKFGLRL